MNKPRQFEETASAARLLREFFVTSRSATTPHAQHGPSVTETFFDKQYLSIVEFLAPVGSDLKRQTPEKKNESVAAFFDMTMRPRRQVSGPVIETIAQFLQRLRQL